MLTPQIRHDEAKYGKVCLRFRFIMIYFFHTLSLSQWWTCDNCTQAVSQFPKAGRWGFVSF